MGLRKHFPLRGGVLQRTQAWVRAVDGVSFAVAPGRDPRHRGGVRLRQVDAGAAAPPIDRARRGPGDVRRRGRAGGLRLAHEAAAPRHAARLPGPLRVAEPAPDHRGRGGVQPARARHAAGGGAGAGARAPGPRRPRSAALRPALRPRAERRPAPAGEHRARARARSAAAGAGRAGVRPRQVGAGAGAEPAAGAQGRARAHLRPHLARPERHRVRERPGARHVPRRGRGDRDRGGARAGAEAPLHPGALRLRAQHGSRPAHGPPADHGRSAESDRPALRLSLPDPLPVRDAPLRGDASAAACR